ncbi:tRNA (N6-threonylcarbamoyladenosine(37)-N6)-methyltransferase TrmO [candidate division GN15 bacterium]|nr:tRNA (N6-threonylcarbamoyladenosine(37)-N6)-methyltransferase TrmO [candidate division GN15 bacterium]
MTITFEPIGIIHTPHTKLEGMPIQPSGAEGIKGTIEIYPPYIDGLSDLDGFSHIILLYHLHKSTDYKLKVVPFLDTVERGLFATRAPRRPNPIGLSVVRLERIEGNIVHIVNVDMLDGTPLLDIKPYVPEFEDTSDIKLGWLDSVSRRSHHHKSDNRFE